jgi:hypothetical protein
VKDSRDQVCFTVRVSRQEADLLQAWVQRRVAAGVDITVTDVLRRCVQAIVRDEPSVAPWTGPQSVVVSAEDAAKGVAETHRLRRLVERVGP